MNGSSLRNAIGDITDSWGVNPCAQILQGGGAHTTLARTPLCAVAFNHAPTAGSAPAMQYTGCNL